MYIQKLVVERVLLINDQEKRLSNILLEPQSLSSTQMEFIHLLDEQTAEAFLCFCLTNNFPPMEQAMHYFTDEVCN